MFDTGAESSNYIYGYFLEELRKHKEIEVIKINETVKFGDQKTLMQIHEAVILDLKFDDPEDPNRSFHQRHVFKVIPLDVKPTIRDTPVIIGLITICCHYLDLMVRNLRFYHKQMREGLSYTDSLEAEISRLNILSDYEHADEVMKLDTHDDNVYVEQAKEMVQEDLYDDLKPEIKEELMMFCRACNVEGNPTLEAYEDYIYEVNEEGNIENIDQIKSDGTSASTPYIKSENIKDDLVMLLEGKIINFKRNGRLFILPESCKKPTKRMPPIRRFWRRNLTIRKQLMLMESLGTKLSSAIKDPSEEAIADITENIMQLHEGKFDKNDYLKDTVDPWSYKVEEAPEERDSHIPCSNTGIYNYLSTTHEEALNKYQIELETNTSPEAYAIFKDLMESDLAKRRFCPKEWTGMNVKPVELMFTDEWPAARDKGIYPKGNQTFVNEKLKDAYKKEFCRLCNYFYVKSNSSTASRIVVADKATPPFCRICGAYTTINKYIRAPQIKIPHIRNECYKARKFRYSLDGDLSNGYHNVPISEASAQALAVTTEWGLYQPRFMPEGVRSAGQEFQRIMSEIFEPISDWSIVIWDNILILADTLEELRDRAKIFLEICDKYNVILKMAKTKIGYEEANFFGYKVKKDSIELSQERKDGIQSLKFFKNKKGAQSFLGSCNFFRDFVPNYSQHTAKLHDMTKDTFNWKRDTWSEDYEQHFENLKSEIQRSLTLHFPDYSKLWILRTDCSKDALGAVLFQVGDNGIYEPIALVSQKLSDQAKNWSAIKLEAYAIYYAVKHLSYYLLGQSFVIEMDHQNLVSMETSDQYIIQRWRCYLENFDFKIKHIKGKQNLLADYQSRMYSLSNFFDFDDVYGDEITDDPLIQLYNQRIHSDANISFMFMNDLEEVDRQEQSLINIVVRDGIRSISHGLPADSTLSHVAAFYDKSFQHIYYHEDKPLLPTTKLSEIQRSSDIIYLDAMHATTRSQTKPTPISTTPPIQPLKAKLPTQINKPTQNNLEPFAPEEEGEEEQRETFISPLKEPVPIIPNLNAQDQFTDLTDDEFLNQDLATQVIELQNKVKAEMAQLHGTRHLHYGANRMYRDACQLFPGHRLPQSYFKDYVSKCVLCQKLRLQKDKLFLERIRTLKADPKPRAAVCIDRVTISPASKSLKKTAIVIADLFTRLAKVYPTTEYTSESVADALKDFLITYGAYDILQSDPGSDILGGAVDAINDRWKLKRKISLVDRHESNGNERLIGEILRHLRSLVNDERAMDRWDDPDFIGFVNFCINDNINSETGLSPYIATFGDRDAAYFSLPGTDRNAPTNAKEYIRRLNESLELVRTLNREYQLKLHAERTATTPAIEQNQFRKGDLIWFRRKNRIDPNGKLYFRNKGPYEVISMRHNDVECKHIVTNQIKTFHVTDVFPVNIDSDYNELHDAALRDQDQFVVSKIINWRGDILTRSTIEFLVLFDDNTKIWKDFLDPDFRNNSVLNEYIDENPILLSLKFTIKDWKNQQKIYNSEKIIPFNKCYIDFRSYNLGWRKKIKIPDLTDSIDTELMKYVFLAEWKGFQNKDKLQGLVSFVHMNYEFTCSNTWIKQFASDKEFNKNTMILLDTNMMKRYPLLKST